MTQINKLVKHKGNFANSLPNYILYDKDFLGLKNIYDLQLENSEMKLWYPNFSPKPISPNGCFAENLFILLFIYYFISTLTKKNNLFIGL
jgi:hypothetical protein